MNSVVNPRIFGTDQNDLAIVRAGFQAALLAEIGTICSVIPPEELAIQFDCLFEITDIYGVVGLPIEGSIERNVTQFEALNAAVAPGTRLGFHLCFGTFGGWPRFAPDSLDRAVELTNEIVRRSPRPIDWIHIPALDTAEPAFYAPLANLAVGDTRIYLGLIHSMGSFAERFGVARRYLSDFGIAGYCGFGRLEPEQIDICLDQHLEAVAIARDLARADA